MVRVLRIVLVLAAASLVGCATLAPSLPSDTLMIAEVSHAVTLGEIQSGRLERPGDAKKFTDEQIASGRVFVVRTYIYWLSALGYRFSMTGLALAPEPLSLAPGNVVEMARGSEQTPWTIWHVRAADLAAGPCYYTEVPMDPLVNVFGWLSLTGPRGAASLYCQGFESEGWARINGLWQRLPGAVAAPAAAGSAPSQAAVDAPPVDAAAHEAAQAAAAEAGLARLILTRNDALQMRAFDLPVKVDGQAVTSLSADTCDVVLLGPGRHVVEAGTGDMSDALGFPKLTLELKIEGSERIVAEYVLDDLQWQRFNAGMNWLFTPRSVWGPQVFRFTQRPANPRDSCPLAHPPRVIDNTAARAP